MRIEQVYFDKGGQTVKHVNARTGLDRRYNRSWLLLITVVCTLALIGQSRGDGFGFSPPSGWRAQKAPAGFVGLWTRPDALEALNLSTASFNGSVSAFANDILAIQRWKTPSLHVYANQPFTICGNHTGRYLIWTSMFRGRSWIHEQMLGLWGTNGYISSYVRPSNHPPSAAARASLVSVCGVAGGGAPNQSAPQAAPAPQSQPAAPANQPPPAPNSGVPTPYVYPSLAPRYVPVIPM
ncbi:MAG: hypothetical protein DLM53_05550 [Candidatus Eremiobacter antarcticus]|nr:hypothetical protein [Candidatus Eremiobacteraeota bacterium]MBC5807004.1 hypothetical protein [Candidatus Eremiobacteraeota bacterium]PZR62862.1 MAG: hypothetical protein DLM53_05550 [Candidatus Eremiobacter sp. RRmetagenome_bin22]